jgi:hypothetical protein
MPVVGAWYTQGVYPLGTPPPGTVSGPASSSARLVILPCAAIPDDDRCAAHENDDVPGTVSLPGGPVTSPGSQMRMLAAPNPIAVEPTSRDSPASTNACRSVRRTITPLPSVPVRHSVFARDPDAPLG